MLGLPSPDRKELSTDLDKEGEEVEPNFLTPLTPNDDPNAPSTSVSQVSGHNASQ